MKMKHLMMVCAMLVLACNISIGATEYRQVNDVVIDSSVDQLQTEATIKLPRVSKVLADQIQVGDAVNIDLAYEGVYEGTEFSGYVEFVSPKIPVEVQCLDATYLLRRTPISKSWKDTTLLEVLNYLVDQTNDKGIGKPITLNREFVPEINFEKFLIDNVNAARAIEELSDGYGLKAYFRDHELYVGLDLIDRQGEVRFDMSRNVIEDNLTFRTADQVKLKVKATSIQKDNTHFDVEFGDPDGEQRTLVYYNIASKNELESLAQRELEKYRFDGYEGTLKTFLIPYSTHGMTAIVESPVYPEKDGQYNIDRVVTRFGVDGASRTVHLGTKLG
jgi:hypothetical protein